MSAVYVLDLGPACDFFPVEFGQKQLYPSKTNARARYGDAKQLPDLYLKKVDDCIIEVELLCANKMGIFGIDSR